MRIRKKKSNFLILTRKITDLILKIFFIYFFFRYECYICHRTFVQRGEMVIHIKYHLGHLNHPCSFCDKRFPHAYALKRHELTHSHIRKKRVCKKRNEIINDSMKHRNEVFEDHKNILDGNR